MRKPAVDLIYDARQYAGLDVYPGAILINELADALAAERDRADRAEAKLADVDAWLISQTNHLPGSAIDDLVAIIEEATA